MGWGGGEVGRGATGIEQVGWRLEWLDENAPEAPIPATMPAIAKIAVASTVPGIDPVGTFVGGHGTRVQAVMNEIGSQEKIDIIAFDENQEQFIKNALSPAEVAKVDPGYLEWLLKQKEESDQIDEDWIYTLKHHLGKLV